MNGTRHDDADELLLKALIDRLGGRVHQAVQQENQAKSLPDFTPSPYGMHLLAAAKRLVDIEGREQEALPLIEIAWKELLSTHDLMELHLVHAYVCHKLGDKACAGNALKTALTLIETRRNQIDQRQLNFYDFCSCLINGHHSTA